MLYEYQSNKPKIGNHVFIAPTAVIIGDVEIDDYSSIWYGVVLRGDLAPIKVGKKSNIQDNCTVHNDTDCPAVIGDSVTIGHNAVIHGCKIENNCLIGIGAIVLTRAIIRTGSIVGAGAVVKEKQIVGPYHLVTGSPARFKKELPPSLLTDPLHPSNIYLELAKQHQIIKSV